MGRKSKEFPQDVVELAKVIDAGRLDNRTNAARRIVSARDAITGNPIQATQAIIFDALAQNVAVLAATTERLAQPDAVILDPAGELSPLVQSMFEVQGQIAKLTQTMLRLESQNQGKPVPGQGSDGLADIILEAQEAQREEGKA